MLNIDLSIIIPVYNVQDYLAECLDSVFSQTFESFEVIVINDGSTDNSLNIIKYYMKNHHNLILINKPNMGQSVARNMGIKAAKGKYLYFLDSDDLIHPDAMLDLYNEAERDNVDLILFNGESFVNEDIKSNLKKYNYKKKALYPNIENGKDLFTKLINNDDYFPSPCLLFLKKSILQKYKLEFFEGIIHEDELFTFQLMLSCNRVKYVNQVYFYRRIRSNSTMTGKNYEKSFIGYSVVINEMIKIEESMSKVNENFKKAIIVKIGKIYGGAIVNFISMNKIEQQNNKGLIKKLNEINKQNSFFYRKDYLLFYYSKTLFKISRIVYEKVSNR